jgi:hypothetical protein
MEQENNHEANINQEEEMEHAIVGVVGHFVPLEYSRVYCVFRKTER